MRSAALILSLFCAISAVTAQVPEHDPDDPYWASFHHVGVPHHEEMIGQSVPEITLAGTDGKEVAISSYRGKPLLIDIWATWCAPCLADLPSLNRLHAELKEKGIAMISVDQDEDAARATEYLARHHYGWTNFHDGDRRVAAALQGDGIPLVVLIDAMGRIVYFDFGGNESDLRKAIAGLGSGLAPGGKRESDESQNPPDQN